MGPIKFSWTLKTQWRLRRKPQREENVVAALNAGGFGTSVRTVRVNDWTTERTYRDVIEVVEKAGSNLDCLVLPKVKTADQVRALDALLTQIEKTMGFELQRIGIEAQIENALGLINVDAIAAASPLVEKLIFGPADFMASPPYLSIHDLDGFRRVASSAAALGFDGKWVLHPSQVAAANEVFSPRQEDYDRAELILDAYQYYTSAGGRARGAVMLGEEMIDEASRKMASVVSAKGRAAGMQRTTAFTPSPIASASGDANAESTK